VKGEALTLVGWCTLSGLLTIAAFVVYEHRKDRIIEALYGVRDRAVNALARLARYIDTEARP
jgi:hypothetical protein